MSEVVVMVVFETPQSSCALKKSPLFIQNLFQNICTAVYDEYSHERVPSEVIFEEEMLVQICEIFHLNEEKLIKE